MLGWRGPLTHRQFLCLQAWLTLDQNEPSRADFYAMRTAQALGGGRLEDYRVEFVEPVPQPRVKAPGQEESVERMKARRMGKRYKELTGREPPK